MQMEQELLLINFSLELRGFMGAKTSAQSSTFHRAMMSTRERSRAGIILNQETIWKLP